MISRSARLAIVTMLLGWHPTATHAAVESRTRLVGHAEAPGIALGSEARGHVRMIIYGVGDISDDCPDAASRKFVSELDGDLALAPDGTFDVPLVPFDPPVATPSGCAVTLVDIERIEGVTIVVSVPALGREGTGWLDFQTLSSVDNGELQRGDYGTLRTSLYFTPPQLT